jgi:GMP synthase (glutamine-hydrolysing)
VRSPAASLTYLLLQVRNADDPMLQQEVACFARALGCAVERVRVFDLLGGCPSPALLRAADVVLLGGSGDYSVAEAAADRSAWLPPALEAMRELDARCQPTFATCWGFQAMAHALGGEVISDPARAEIGTLPLQLTAAGRADPVFGPLAEAGASFDAQIGHQDSVTRVPPQAALLAHSARANHAYRLADKPIYCTQFHPELTHAALLERVRHYPSYVETITGLALDEFIAQRTREAPEAGRLLVRFLDVVFG